MTRSTTMDLLQVAADMRASGQWLASLRVMDEAAPDYEYRRRTARTLGAAATLKWRRMATASASGLDTILKEWYSDASVNLFASRQHPTLMLLNPTSHAQLVRSLGPKGGSLEVG